MSKPQVVYWDLKGRAGAAFYMLAESKVEFEHVKEAPEMAKVLTALGAESTNFAPPLFIDGETKVSQSLPVCMAVGKKTGFDKGVDELKALQYMLDVTDLDTEITKAAGSAETLFAFVKGTDGPSRMSKWLGNIERSIKGPFYFGETASYVDYWLAQSVTMRNFTLWDAVGSKYDPFAQSPKAKAVAEFILNQDSVKGLTTMVDMPPPYAPKPEMIEAFLKLLDSK